MTTPLILTLILQLRDLSALQAVCRRRGWEFRAGQRSYRGFGRVLSDRPGLSAAGQCAHAIGMPGCLYEIGLLRRRGHYLPVWEDGPHGGLNAAWGRGGVFWRGYVAEKTRRAAFRRGHAVSGHTDYAGTLRLRIVAEGRVAHVRVGRDGETTLWIFDAADRSTFDYLAEALGRARSETLALLEPAASEPSDGPRNFTETSHDSVVLDQPPFLRGSDCPAEPPSPAPIAGGSAVGALSALRPRDDRVHRASRPGVSLCVR